MLTTRRSQKETHLEALSDINLDALLCGPAKHLIQHDVGNHLDLALSELPEDDDLVNSVEELWPATHSDTVSVPRADSVCGGNPGAVASPSKYKCCIVGRCAGESIVVGRV